MCKLYAPFFNSSKILGSWWELINAAETIVESKLHPNELIVQFSPWQDNEAFEVDEDKNNN